MTSMFSRRRNSDPETAHRAAAAYEPTLDSKKGLVLAYLRENIDEWVTVVDLRAAGGPSGDRRMRDLTVEGFPIIRRQKPGAPNTWQYSLRSEA